MGIDLRFDSGKSYPALADADDSIFLVHQLCKNFSHIVACRFFLGFVGEYNGILLLLV